MADYDALRGRVGQLLWDWAEAEIDTQKPLEAGDFRTVVKIANVIADEGRAILRRCVGESRREGVSWADIGAGLGITKQAAQQRFSEFDVVDSDLIRVKEPLGIVGMGKEVLELGERGFRLKEVRSTGLYFERTPHRWEHDRTFGPMTRDRLDTEHWQPVAHALRYYYRRMV